MPKARWGEEAEFFGPRHAHREGRILRALKRRSSGGRHLECAAGLGSLSRSLAREGRSVIAADLSLQSLLAIRRSQDAGSVLPVLADITALPFPDGSFDSASSAETLEHIPEDAAAAGELARVLREGGFLVGTVPAGPKQWSDWDVWADHKRRYTRRGMEKLLGEVGLKARVLVWGWPFLRIYDDLFLKRVNRRRLETRGPAEKDPALKRVARLGKNRFLVSLLRLIFEIDRIFDGLPWGVGLLFIGEKPLPPQAGKKLDKPSSSLS